MDMSPPEEPVYADAWRRPPPDLVAAWHRDGLWTDDTVADRLGVAAAVWPDRILTVASESRPAEIRLTDFHHRAQRAAAGLRGIGVRPGDVVAVQAPSWLETWLAYSAAILAGAVVLPIVPIYGKAELAFILAEAKPAVIVTPVNWKGIDYPSRVRPLGLAATHVVFGEAAQDATISWTSLEAGEAFDLPCPNTDPDDVAVLIYTSGTTSRPKGAQHSHRSLLAELETAKAMSPDERRMLVAWPPGHVAGFLAYLGFAAQGVTTILLDSWNAAEAARLVEERKITSSAGTNFHLAGLLDAADDAGLALDSLSDFRAGGASIPADLVLRSDRRGISTYKSYGLTEHPSLAFGHPGDSALRRARTDGRISPGSQVRIIDDEGRDLPPGIAGEILCRGPETFVGYREPSLNDLAFLAGGWLRTGDVGVLSPDGYLTITDRAKDIIIRGGENISSREVEEYALLHPNIASAAAIGVPHETLGEKVGLFVTTRDGTEVTVAQIGEIFQDQGVARQKTPEAVFCVADLPRNATGKVLKHVLRAQLAKADTSATAVSP
jgi:acyl-CoA synthetase (AMP-forming)/AMP-acid ligase II